MTRDLDSFENNYNAWDDVWMIRETKDEITSEWPKGPSRSKSPSDKDQ